MLQDISSICQDGDFVDDENTEINFKRLRTFASTYYSQIYYYQRRAFAFVPVPQVQEYLAKAIVISNTDDLMQMSLQCETKHQDRKSRANSDP